MKKLVNIAVFFAFGLLAKTNALAQCKPAKQSEDLCATAFMVQHNNTVETRKRVFYVEGEYNAAIKLELKATHDVTMRVTVYDSKEKIVFEKTVSQKGYHTLQFDSTAFEVYKVVIESTSEVDIEVEKRNFL